MPSHQQNLDAVRFACVRANPSIVLDDCESGKPKEECGCYYCKSGARLRPIQVSDVLLALGNVKGLEFVIDTRGWVRIIYAHREMRNGESFTEGRVGSPLIRLDLRATLSSWDEASVAALANLLKNNG